MSSFRRLLLSLTCFSLGLFGGLLPFGSLSAQDAAPAAGVSPAEGSPPSAAEPAVAAPVPDVPAPAAAAAPASAPDAAPAPSDDERVARAVAVPKPARFPLPARDPAVPEGDYIGHSFAEPNDSGGWGWIKLPNDPWKKARWVALEETPGVASAPWRDLGPTASRTSTQNYEYKMHGFFAPYQVYDPHTNEMLDVFVLESYETIGPAQPLTLRSGPENRHGDRARSGISSRPRADDY